MEVSTDSLNEDQIQFLDAMRRNTDRLEVLINDLLDLSRLEGGMVTLERSEFPFGDVVTQVLSEMKPDIEGKELKVVWRGDSALVQVLGDRPRVVQIVANLLSNAVKYSPEKSLIEVDVDPVTEASEFLKVNVRDHGLGISKEDINKLFHRFYRIDN